MPIKWILYFLFKHSFQLIALTLAFSSANVYAQQNDMCNLPLNFNKKNQSNHAINFEADNIYLNVGLQPATNLTGNVVITSNESITTSNSAKYNPDKESLNLEGNVQFENNNLMVSSESALFSYLGGEILFNEATFVLGDNISRGNAESIELQEEGILNLRDVNYTTCPVGSNDWFIKAKNIVLDLDEGEAQADKVSLSFKDIPILYIPKISFPLGDARKSGFLAPEIGGGGRSGNEIRLPWYWNIAKNYDATITPRILTGRGFQLGNEFRYISSTNKSQLKLDYLNNDNIFGASRHYIQFNNETNFANGIRTTIDYGNTSDGNYFEDLGGNLSMTSITHLNQNIMMDAFGENWSFLARFQNFQTIDKSILLTDRPYARLPQLKFNASLPYKPLGISTSLDSEIVFFDRDVGVTGWRIDTQPELDWEIKKEGWYVNPSIALKHTQYQLKNFEKDQISDPSRTIPIASLDAGLFFERPLENYTQTFEPRLLYLNTPYRDQKNLPIFDTIEPDLNLVQLFRKNRFIGIDRIADTEQISLGFGSKVIDNKDGKEVISVTLGKSFYLNNQKVTLPGRNFIPSSNSDFIAELRFLIFDDLNFDISHQWNNENSGVARSQARIQYRSENNRILNFGYRFRQNLLEQGNISWSWPISETWNVLGHYNYSIKDKRTLEQFYGLEYESCCWAVRMVYRQYVSTRDGQEDTSLGIQLVLKGMTSIGTKADKLLERGILGYSNYIQ